jgi:uncharacterized protein YjiK
MTVARAGAHPLSGRRAARGLAVGLAAAAVAVLAGPVIAPATAAPLSGVDLSTYVRTGRYDLPEPSRTTTTPAGSLLAREASGVTFDRDTGTLFVVGDGGTSVVQVSRTGQLIDSMSLATGGAPGTEFADTEGIAYVGGGRFVVTEERLRQANLFTYAPGTTLTRANARTVKLGTTIDNIGIEGITYDPGTSRFVAVKEKDPEGIFETGIDFDAGTATNGSPTTTNSANLFDPAKIGTSDLSDVFALSNLTTLTGTDASHLLVISQEAGKVVEVDRTGEVRSTLTIVGDPDNPLSVPDQTFEGVTMDEDGALYVVNEQGGGDSAHPQLWVYTPSTVPNAAPTAVTLGNRTASLAENTSTATRLKVASVTVADDGLGQNGLTVTGPDAAAFEVDANGLYLKAGTTLDYEAKTSYTVSVAVDDPAVGSTPDATSAAYTLAVTDVTDESSTTPSVTVSEVAPWGSDATYKADWFEVTNTGTTPVDLTAWKVDDSSNAFGNALTLNGVGVLRPGQSAVFLEVASSADAANATVAAFKTAWFGDAPPAGLRIGTYTGGGIGFSSGGDAVNLFTPSGDRATGVSFGASTANVSFDNAAGVGSTTLPLPAISTLSEAGRNGAFVAGGATGSPGTTQPAPFVSEVAPWGSAKTTTYGADWFEITNPGTLPLDLEGWRMDDGSNASSTAVALSGVPSIPPGGSAVFLEASTDAPVAAFRASWFGTDAADDVLVGRYSGSGVGLSNDGDGVALFDAAGDRRTAVAFGASTAGVSFDNAAGLGGTTTPPTISTLSVRGRDGAYVASGETGSPGTTRPDTTKPVVTWTGAAETYVVGETVAVACSATDERRGSGLASDTCEDVTRPAADFGVGQHELTATATDHAGNVGTATVRFTVLAAPVTTQPGTTTPEVVPSVPVTTPTGPTRPTPPRATLRLASSARAATLVKGIVARLSGLQGGSAITIRVRRGSKTLEVIRATAGRAGTRRVGVRLTRRQLAGLRGRTLTVRVSTVGADGRTKVLTETVRVR